MAHVDDIRLFLMVLGIAVTASVVQCASKELRIPALGTIAQLGQLYDARNAEFRQAEIFRTTKIPNDAIKVVNVSKATVDTTTSNSFKHRLQLLNIDGHTAANLLSGLVKPEGAAEFLRNTHLSQTDVSGILLFKYQTVQENLQIFHEELKALYNQEMLLFGDATHVLTGIKWGANVALTLKSTANSRENRQDLNSALQNEIEIFTSAGVTRTENNSNFTMSFKADIALPILKPTNHKQVKEMLDRVPNIIQGTEGGKGAPIEFTLTPLGLFREHLLMPKEPAVAHKIDEWVLQKFVDIYDDISSVDQQLNDLSSVILSNAICITPETKAKLSQLISDFDASKLKFKNEFNFKLVNVRSGHSSTDVLSNLVQAYNVNQFNSKYIRTELAKFDVALQKIKLYNVLKNSDLPIEYFGLNIDFTTRVQENLENIIYVLFQSPQFAQNNPESFKSNLNTFLTTLSKPFNKRFVVDCDFGHTECATKRETTITQMYKGQTTFEDVNLEMQKATAATPLKIKAIGRFAQIGELIDVRTDEFTGRSILNSKSSEYDNLKILAAPLSETIIVPSGRYHDKFEALKIEPQQQFSILAETVELTRSGLYLNLQEEVQEIASIVNIRHLSESEMKINDAAFLSSLDFSVALKPSATHFVSKIEYGFNTIFTIQNDGIITPNATELQDYLNHLKSTILQFNLNSKIKDSNATTQLEFKHTVPELPSNWKIKIFSDTQGVEEEPTVIETSEDLLIYLNTTLLRQQFIQNFGKGQPITYVLEPIHNLRAKGVLGESVSFGILSTSNYESVLFQNIYGEVRKAKSQIETISKDMAENPDCVTEHDGHVLKEIERHFESKGASINIRLKTLVKQIWTGDVRSGSSNLIRLAQDFRKHNVFSFNGRYSQLQGLTPFEQRLHLYKQIKGSSIKYLGRNSSETYFSFVLDTNDKAFRYYLLYYKPERVRGKADVWSRTRYLFFSSLVNGKQSSRNTKLYLVDCDFGHQMCDGMTQPAIHVYKEGKLISDDFVGEVEEDEKERPKMSHEIKSILEDMDRTIASVNDNVATVNTEVTKIKTDITTLDREVSAANKTCLANIAEMSDKFAIVETKVTTKRLNLEELMTRLDTVNGTAIGNQNHIYAFEAVKAQVTKNKNDIDKCAAVKDEVTQNKNDIAIFRKAQVTDKFAAVESKVTKNENSIVALRTGLDAVKRTATQNQIIMRSANPCEEVKQTSISNATKSARFGCGGTIQLPSKGESIVLDLNLAATTGATQRCLWTLHATQNNRLVKFKVKLILLCKQPTHILDDNTLTFTEWHHNGHTNKDIITNRISFSQNSFLLTTLDYRGFLSFNSQRMNSEAGFVLRVDVLDTDVASLWSSLSATLKESFGSVPYSLPSSLDWSSIVINPQPAAKMTLTVDVDSSGQSNPCLSYDSVDILEFGMDGVPKQLGRLCGRQLAISYETDNPLAALFYWHGNRSGQGVKLTWK